MRPQQLIHITPQQQHEQQHAYRKSSAAEPKSLSPIKIRPISNATSFEGWRGKYSSWTSFTSRLLNAHRNRISMNRVMTVQQCTESQNRLAGSQPPSRRAFEAPTRVRHPQVFFDPQYHVPHVIGALWPANIFRNYFDLKKTAISCERLFFSSRKFGIFWHFEFRNTFSKTYSLITTNCFDLKKIAIWLERFFFHHGIFKYLGISNFEIIFRKGSLITTWAWEE